MCGRDPCLWLSRSWTSRERRPGEDEQAYVFTDRAAFEARIAAGGFLEWTDFLGNYYGTPMPEAPPGRDVVLEIELHGAKQVRARDPDALLIFVVSPSREEQERRLRGRGDTDEHVQQRLRKALDEEPEGRAIADAVIVNDDVGRAVDEIQQAIARRRRAQRAVG